MFMNFKENKCIWVSINCLILAILVIQIILVAMNIGINSSDEASLEALRDNFHLRPIIDLKFSDSTYCDFGYEPIVLATWPGINEGCDCSRKDSSNSPFERRGKITIGKCTEEMKEEGCKKIEGKKEENITKWNGVQLCAKYSSSNGYSDYLSKVNTDYKSSIRKTYEEEYDNHDDEEDDNDHDQDNDNDKNNKCRKGYSACNSYLDESEQFMCVPTGQDCPINDVVINNYNSYRSNGIKYKSQGINVFRNWLYIHTTNKVVKKPVITKFAISEKGVCLSNSDIYTNYPQYVLDKNYEAYKSDCKIKYKTAQFDPRYASIDSITKRVLYESNSIKGLINLPGYPANSLDATMNLFFRGYFGYDSECLDDDKFDSNFIENTNNKIKSVSDLSITILVFASTTLILHVIFGSIQLCCPDCLDKCLNGTNIILLACHVLIFILAIPAVHFMNSIDGRFDCWNKYTKTLLEDTFDVHQKNIDFNIVVLSFALIVIVIYLVIIIMRCLRPDKPAKVEVIDNNMLPKCDAYTANPELKNEVKTANPELKNEVKTVNPKLKKEVKTVNPEMKIKEVIELPSMNMGEIKKTETLGESPAPQLAMNINDETNNLNNNSHNNTNQEINNPEIEQYYGNHPQQNINININENNDNDYPLQEQKTIENQPIEKPTADDV